MSEEEEDVFKAIQKADKAFWESLDKDDWDLELELTITVKRLDIEDKTLYEITRKR